jgi:NADH-quinone oxidoreductase subunit J
MSVNAAFFYLFATITIASGVMVIASRNPVQSVLFLILAFVNAAGLFVMMGAEFLAMILVIVYVGAVAVLFLFVVMMLDVDFAELRQGFLQNLPIGSLIGIVFLIELIAVITSYVVDPALIHTPVAGAVPSAPGAVATAPVVVPAAPVLTNTEAIGQVLYTRYFYFFQTAGLILLVAMIGAIVLTLRERLGVKRQDISKQNARTPAAAIDVRKVPFRQGI